MRTVAVIALASVSCLSLSLLTACQKAAAPSSSAASNAAVSGAPVAAAPAAPSSGPIALADLPRRKAGLWKQTMTVEGAPGPIPATEICVDPSSESRMAAFGQHEAQDKCSSQTFSRNLDGSITFSASCPLGRGGTSTTKGTVTGDFGSNYTVALDSRVAGAGPHMDGEHKMTITAAFEGPCPSGEKPGEITMIMPGGTKLHMPAGMSMAGPPSR